MHTTTRTPIRTPGRLLVAAVVGLVATTRPCSAFYFKGGPGDGLPSVRSLIASGSPDFGNPPSGRNLSQPGPGPFHPGGGGRERPAGPATGGRIASTPARPGAGDRHRGAHRVGRPRAVAAESKTWRQGARRCGFGSNLSASVGRRKSPPGCRLGRNTLIARPPTLTPG